METPRVVLLTLVLGLPTMALAQAPEERPAANAATIRTTVQEVVLDLIVRDARGREVKNLKPADVEIYEDGARQDIRSFRMVTGKEVMKQAAGAGGRRPAGFRSPDKGNRVRSKWRNGRVVEGGGLENR